MKLSDIHVISPSNEELPQCAIPIRDEFQWNYRSDSKFV